MTTVRAIRKRHKDNDHGYTDVEHCMTLACIKFREESGWPSPRDRDFGRVEALLVEVLDLLRKISAMRHD